MENIKEETAKLLKEKGFNEYCSSLYGEYCGYIGLHHVDNQNKHNEIGQFSAPTQSVLQKWIREKHKIHIEIHPDNYDEVDNEWRFCLFNLSPDVKLEETTESMIYRTYENAMEAGLKMALNYIKNE